MITAIRITNFKGISETVEVQIRPITLLFGGNSAGKSSILQALQYAAEVMERRNLDPGPIGAGLGGTDLGGFANLVHGHDLSREVGLGFTLEQPYEDGKYFFGVAPTDLDDPSSLLKKPKKIDIEIAIAWDSFENQPFISRYSVTGDDIELVDLRRESGSKQVVFQLNEDHPALIRDSEHNALQFWEPLGEYISTTKSVLEQLLDWANDIDLVTRTKIDVGPFTSSFSLSEKDALPDLEKRIKLEFDLYSQGSFDEVHRARLPEMADYVHEAVSHVVVFGGYALRESLREFRALGPIREIPSRNFEPSRQLQDSRWVSGLGAWDRLATCDSGLVEQVSDWLGGEDRLDSGYAIRIKRFKELDLSNPLVGRLLSGRLFDEDDAGPRLDLSSLITKTRVLVIRKGLVPEVELLPGDVGVGISQVLPVIVTAIDGSGRLVSIEQPELHIHPRLQARLADLFINRSWREKNRFLLETHSEHLILRLQRRIRETEAGKVPSEFILRSKDVAIHHVRSEGGVTRTQRIELDKTGEFIQPWPDDFFEIDFFERFGDAQ